jgi:DNA polymerase-4
LITASDIRKSSPHKLKKIVGSYATFLFELAHGEDSREVDPTSDPKSRGSETTFEKDILSSAQLLKHLQLQAQEISLDLKRLERLGRSITLKIKYSDFTSITRTKTLFHPTDDSIVIYQTAEELLHKDTEVGIRSVRLIGISVGNLIAEGDPLQLWFEFY